MPALYPRTVPSRKPLSTCKDSLSVNENDDEQGKYVEEKGLHVVVDVVRKEYSVGQSTEFPTPTSALLNKGLQASSFTSHHHHRYKEISNGRCAYRKIVRSNH